MLGAPGETRTPDTRLRRPLLYPAELQAHMHALSQTRLSLVLLERVMGIGPTQPAWKASVLPLNYTRMCMHFKFLSGARYAQLNARVL